MTFKNGTRIQVRAMDSSFAPVWQDATIIVRRRAEPYPVAGYHCVKFASDGACLAVHESSFRVVDPADARARISAAVQLLINLPFPGFYDSVLSNDIDREAEQFAEYRATEEGEDSELNYPPELRLSEGELAEILFRVTSYRDAYKKVAHVYCDALNNVASEALGFPLEMAFESMTSPREYNFETDRLFAYIPLKVCKRLLAYVKADGLDELGQVIRRRHTSYDGFHSFYDNDISSWIDKPIRDWDHNELGTLFQAALEKAWGGDESPNGNPLWLEVYYEIGEGFYEEWESAVDWPAFEAKREDLRLEKLEALREVDPGAFPEYGTPPDLVAMAPVRCPLTLDLFGGDRV